MIQSVDFNRDVSPIAFHHGPSPPRHLPKEDGWQPQAADIVVTDSDVSHRIVYDAVAQDRRRRLNNITNQPVVKAIQRVPVQIDGKPKV
jgi:hypothetical protein